MVATVDVTVAARAVAVKVAVKVAVMAAGRVEAVKGGVTVVFEVTEAKSESPMVA